MSASRNDIRRLFIGIGNSSRGDDALGWLLADFVKENFPAEWEVEHRYQLQVEDAELISHFDEVIFADASEEKHQEGFSFQACHSAETYFHSSHLQTPEAVMYLCKKLYHKSPAAFILSITGHQWDLGQPLSEEAACNLTRAEGFLKERLKIHSLETPVGQKCLSGQ